MPLSERRFLSIKKVFIFLFYPPQFVNLSEKGLKNSSSEVRPPRCVFFECLPKAGQHFEALGSIPLFALYGVLFFHHHHARYSIRRSSAVPIHTSPSFPKLGYKIVHSFSSRASFLVLAAPGSRLDFLKKNISQNIY